MDALVNFFILYFFIAFGALTVRVLTVGSGQPLPGSHQTPCKSFEDVLTLVLEVTREFCQRHELDRQTVLPNCCVSNMELSADRKRYWAETLGRHFEISFSPVIASLLARWSLEDVAVFIHGRLKAEQRMLESTSCREKQSR